MRILSQAQAFSKTLTVDAVFPTIYVFRNRGYWHMGPLTEARQENSFQIVMTDRYSKLTNAFSIIIFTAPVNVTIFLVHRIVSSRISNTVSSETGPEFVSKFFAALSVLSKTKTVPSTDYHMPSNWLVKMYNKTLMAHLRHFINKRQTNLDLFDQPITKGYRAQLHLITQTSLFSLVTSQKLPRALVAQNATTNDSSQLCSTQAKLRVVERFRQPQKRVLIKRPARPESFTRETL